MSSRRRHGRKNEKEECLEEEGRGGRSTKKRDWNILGTKTAASSSFEQTYIGTTPRTKTSLIRIKASRSPPSASCIFLVGVRRQHPSRRHRWRRRLRFRISPHYGARCFLLVHLPLTRRSSVLRKKRYITAGAQSLLGKGRRLEPILFSLFWP